jgi:hypothetical protein
MNRETALRWLYAQLRKKRQALGRAEAKPNADASETGNLRETIEMIEWIIGKVLEGE